MTPAARLFLCLVIGFPVLAPERAAAQDQTSATILAVPENDRAFGRRLESLFKIDTSDWAVGFELALGMGESAAPPLRRKLLREKNQERRLLWIAAYGLAANAPHELYQRLKLKGAERSMAMFVLAMGPARAEGARSLQDALRSGSDTVATIVTCLALARFEDRTQGVARKLLASQDPGKLGTALYVNPSLSPQEISAHLEGVRVRPQHKDLVWRGYYLATARTAAEKKALPGRRAAAVNALASAATGSKIRPAAALFLARAGPGQRLTEELIQGLDDETSVVLALSRPLRSQLLEAGRIPAEPSPTQARDEIRRRQVVLFACSSPLPALRRAISKWPKTCPDLMDEICLALALRLATNERDRKMLAGELDRLGRDDGGRGALTEAGMWLRLAQHLDLPAESRTRVSQASRLLQLALRDAFDDAAFARAVERILWERGSHPGLSGLEQHRAFASDLLLAHAAPTASQTEPYVPKGIVATGNDFPLIISRLFKFIRSREPWALREHHLQL